MSGIGPTEILLVLGVVILLFGGKKLPELARGSGKALRIFKTEVTSLTDDDDDDETVKAQNKSQPKPAELDPVEVPETVEKKHEQG